MTKIDFHTNVPDKIAYTCRLVRKALTTSPDSRIVVLTEDRNTLTRLDEALWTFSDPDFLPHAKAGDPIATQTPVILTDSEDADLPHHQILVNLSSGVPSSFAKFERMIEVIGSEDADTEAGRQRYSHYRKRGYALTHTVSGKA